MAPLDHLHFTLYTREGCHLCDSAQEALLQEQRRFGFALEVIDVDTDSDLARLHGDAVPVVAVNGKVRFHGEVNAVLLRRLLRAESRTRRGS